MEVGPGAPHLSVGPPVLLHALATCVYCQACRAGDDMHCTSSFFPGIDSPGANAAETRALKVLLRR